LVANKREEGDDSLIGLNNKATFSTTFCTRRVFLSKDNVFLWSETDLRSGGKVLRSRVWVGSL